MVEVTLGEIHLCEAMQRAVTSFADGRRVTVVLDAETVCGSRFVSSGIRNIRCHLCPMPSLIIIDKVAIVCITVWVTEGTLTMEFIIQDRAIVRVTCGKSDVLSDDAASCAFDSLNLATQSQNATLA